MSLTIRKLTEKDIDSVVAIFREVWGEQIVQRFYKQNIWFEKIEPNASFRVENIVLEINDKIVGFTRVMYGFHKLSTATVQSASMMDVVTSPHQRGVGVKLLRYFLDQPESLLNGVSEYRTGVLWEKLAKRPSTVSEVKRLVLIIKPSIFLTKKGIPSWGAKLADFAWSGIVVLNSKIRSLSGSSKIQIENQPPRQDEYDEFYQKFARKFYSIQLRDYSFFKWRFLDSPFEYLYVTIRALDGSLGGYGVFRLRSINQRKVLLVVDMLAVDQEEIFYSSLLRHAIQIGIKHGADDIQALDTGCSALRNVFKRFFSISRLEKEVFRARIKSEQAYAEEMYGETWFFSLAESDNELSMFP